MTTPLELIDFRAVRKGSLVGFATLRIGRSMRLHDVTVHRRNGRSWAYPPGRPRLDPGGALIRERGKIAYAPTVTFGDREGFEKFSDAVVALVRARHPGAMP